MELAARGHGCRARLQPIACGSRSCRDRDRRRPDGARSPLQADLSKAESAARSSTQAVSSLGRLDVLVNMASVYSVVPFEATDEAVWARSSTSICGPRFSARARPSRTCAPRAAGRIVNFSDWVAASGRPRYPGYLAYYVAKRGVIGLTEALALELASSTDPGQRHRAGPILPPTGTTAEESAAVEAATPVGRWGGEIEIVKAVLFCLESDFMTGETHPGRRRTSRPMNPRATEP